MHWVVCGLPDGRTARARWDDPVCPAIRRRDYAAVAMWLDAQMAAGNWLAAVPVGTAEGERYRCELVRQAYMSGQLALPVAARGEVTVPVAEEYL